MDNGKYRYILSSFLMRKKPKGPLDKLIADGNGNEGNKIMSSIFLENLIPTDSFCNLGFFGI